MILYHEISPFIYSILLKLLINNELHTLFSLKHTSFFISKLQGLSTYIYLRIDLLHILSHKKEISMILINTYLPFSL